MNIPSQTSLTKLYGETEKSCQRFLSLAENFRKHFGTDDVEFFSAPGRTEIIGNHTDHNGGLIIAASITMDTIGAARPNGSNTIHIVSEGYDRKISVNLDRLGEVPKNAGTDALIAGMMKAAAEAGFKTAGFDAYVSTSVIRAAGVSSSASFEMLICSIINYFFNEGKMDYTDYAKIGQYAENKFWDKASGLMDQMACAVGGPILLDFSGEKKIVSQEEQGCGTANDFIEKNGIRYRKLDFSFHRAGYRLVIVNTGKGHADLSKEYSDIPMEMREAASVLGATLLCESDIDSLLSHLSEIKNDRAALRALHFFEENRRVKESAKAIAEENYEELLRLIGESGTSSLELLQNGYSLQDCSEQKISLALALTRLFLNKLGKGTCRIHGGGFAGVIMCVVPENETEHYVDYIASYVGRENVYPMDIRGTGAVHLDKA